VRAAGTRDRWRRERPAYGDPAQVTGVAVTWTPSLEVLREAAAEGLNFVLSHEILWFPSSDSPWYATLSLAERPHNIARRELLDRHGMAVCRCHSNWDCIPEHGIADSCARALGLGEPTYRSKYVRLYTFEPVTVAELAQRAKTRLGVPGARVVQRIGVGYGGFGQSWQCLDEFIMQGAEAVILARRLTAPSAPPSTRARGHRDLTRGGREPACEFACLLQERLPELPVWFIDAGIRGLPVAPPDGPGGGRVL
jgi:hypothetical protein